MSQLEFDEQAAAAIESMYLIGDAARRRGLVREALGPQPGERILDVGCGPGFYCVELADDVGPAGAVVGLDASPAMLALAARRCAGRANIELHESGADRLPVEDAGFDRALSVQVLEYLTEPTQALAEMHRVLRPGGGVLVWDIDWATISVHSQDRALTARVLRAWDEHLAHRSLPRTLAGRLRSVGFEAVEMRAHAFATAGADPDAYGYALVPFIGDFVAGRQGLAREDAEAWVAEQQELAERGEFFFSTTQFCFTARKPSLRLSE